MWNYKNPYNNGHPTTHNMDPERLSRIKNVLTLSSTSGGEKEVIDYIVSFCQQHGFEYILDELGTVLITKGTPEDGQYYPLIGAHTDTVHKTTNKVIVERSNILTAFQDGIQVGIGGDDLAGVAICLELLLIIPVLKVGLFVSEENGCVGSRYSVMVNHEWFRNVAYMIEFDGPEDYMVTQICSGVRLFETKGEFIKKTIPLLQESMGEKLTFFNHPYTDVSIIKQTFPFSCINISAGYFNWHTSQEYVVISEMEKAINLGEKIINELGLKRYEFINKNYTTPIYNPFI